MRLTVYTDYALRVLIYIAVHPEPRPTIGQIASTYGVSRNHLMKVVYQLGVAGYIETLRGKNGGLRLARSPQDIGLGDVVRQTEPDFDLVPCFSSATVRCAITPVCKLRDVLHQAKAAFLQVLDSFTLADLVENRVELQALLVRGPTQDGPNVNIPAREISL